MDDNKIKTVVVLGMHRSGTSAVAGILHRLGINMGENLLSNRPDNPKGHTEDLDFVQLNEDILRTAGGSWSDPPAFKEIISLEPQFNNKIDKLINYKNQNLLWGWKDPRTSLTLELYFPYLRNARYIVTHREDTAIISSLDKRDRYDSSLRKSYKNKTQHDKELIQHYYQEISGFFKRHPGQKAHRLNVDFETTLEGPQSTIKKIINLLEIKPTKNQVSRAVEHVS